jgi:xanthine dehydrogenase molybdopterin-binding subunit B
MTTYIGAPISRIDGEAKVTDAAKYADEFGTADLAHASIIASTIPKGRIARIDVSKALSVEGVIDVLTHQNRPPMASTDKAYKDDVAPEGSPFRPLYDDRVWFNGQPIAIVVAEEPEISRFAASAGASPGSATAAQSNIGRDTSLHRACSWQHDDPDVRPESDRSCRPDLGYARQARAGEVKQGRRPPRQRLVLD